MKSKNFRIGMAMFCLVFISILHLPVGFATSTRWKPALSVNPVKVIVPEEDMRFSLYETLHLQEIGLSEQAFDYAINGLDQLLEKGEIENDHIISIIDFTKSSSQKRLFIIDLEQSRLLFNTYVAHGQNSGKEYATRFSNTPESFQSSLGFYETSGTYQGKNGYSMQLVGLEKGINDKADKRAIVMHGAPYVSDIYIRSQGYIGRSWGCPAVPEKLNKPIIDKIKNGSCLFIYAQNKNYLSKSKILNS